jgi:hypothetical protein
MRKNMAEAIWLGKVIDNRASVAVLKGHPVRDGEIVLPVRGAIRIGSSPPKRPVRNPTLPFPAARTTTAGFHSTTTAVSMMLARPYSTSGPSYDLGHGVEEARPILNCFFGRWTGTPKFLKWAKGGSWPSWTCLW